jgi:hypothetical protein
MRLLLICLALGAAPNFAGAADVNVHLRMVEPGSLELSYQLPPGCARLPFERHNEGYQKIRAAWKSLDSCGAADGGALTRSAEACGPLRFQVPVSTDKVVGYPGAFPIGEAVYAHISKYAVTAACGSVSYQFAAPGSVGLKGKIHHANAASGDADVAVLLMPRVLPPSDGVLAYYDPALSAEAVAQIAATLESTVAFYRKALPDARFSLPILAAGLASEPGGPNVGGDAADIMRFTFFNWPRQPQPEVRRLMTKLVAHEISHRFQLRDAVDAYPDARLIHEGGGEFLRWVVSVKKGWLTPDQAARELDQQLAVCMLGVGQRSWGDVPRAEVANSFYDYSCGLPAYVYALAARQGKGSALARINDFYKDLGQGATPGFERALECGSEPRCQPRWLPQLLGKSGPMGAAWNALLATTGLATLAAPTQQQIDTMMNGALVQLVKDDCGGNSSTTAAPDGMIIDTMKACAALRKDAYVTRVENLAVYGGAQALPAMAAACTARSEVRLGLKNGETLVLPCKRAYAARAQFFRADIARVLARLDLD